MSERIPIFSPRWTDPEQWPYDTAEAVFIGRALNQIGMAVASGWEGVEFGLIPFASVGQAKAELQSRAEAISRADSVAAKLSKAAIDAQLKFQTLQKLAKLTAIKPHTRAGAAAGRVSSTNPLITAPVQPIDLQAEAAKVRAAADAMSERYKAAVLLIEAAEAAYVQRSATVRHLVVPAFMSGDLAASYRWDGDGSLHPCPPHWWNADHAYVAKRFESCKIDRLNPTLPAPPRSVSDWCWLYVDRGSLADFLARHRTAAAAPVENWWPGTAAMVTAWAVTDQAHSAAVARRKLAGDANPSRKAIARELVAMWREAGREDGTPGSIEGALIAGGR